MNRTVVFVSVSFFSILFGVQASEFVVAKKETPRTLRCSASKLKEQIGHATKDAFHASRSLVRHIGKVNILVADLQSKKIKQLGGNDNLIAINKQGGELLITLSALQKKFSATLGCLLDNQAPFKRAGKVDLNASHIVMHDLVATLEKQRQRLKICQSVINNSIKLAIDRPQDFSIRVCHPREPKGRVGDPVQNIDEKCVPTSAGMTAPLSNNQFITDDSELMVKSTSQPQKVSMDQAVAQLSATMLDVCQQSLQLQMRMNADKCLKQIS